MLKPGDKVVVRDDLRDDCTRYFMNDSDEYTVVVAKMLDFRGMTVTITTAHPDKGYSILEDFGMYRWTDEMFIPPFLEENLKPANTVNVEDFLSFLEV